MYDVWSIHNDEVRANPRKLWARHEGVIDGSNLSRADADALARRVEDEGRKAFVERAS